MRITGMGITRSMVRPLFPGEDEESRARWTIELIPDQDGGRARAFFADLSIVEEGWTLGLSGWVVVEFRTKKLVRGLPEGRLESVYGPWVEDAIYSFIRYEGRALASRTTGCGIELPTVPPPRLSPSREHASGVDSTAQEGGGPAPRDNPS